MFANGSKTIDFKDLNISEDELLFYYFGINDLPCVINSPLRTDKHPSFYLYITDNFKIRYKDLATKDKGGIYDLLMKYFNLTFQQLITKIELEFVSSSSFSLNIKKQEFKRVNKRVYTDLQVKVREWKEWDYLYWESYGISIPWAIFGDIYPISHSIITKDNNTFVIPSDPHAYVYVERKDGVVSLKTYQPFSKTHKWISKHDGSVWDLWQQLPKTANNLIITSSRKDALCIWENTGIPSTGLQCESYLPKENVVQELKNRFKNIYVLYDNDFTKENNPGRTNGKLLADTFGLIQIEIPDIYECKDMSDVAFKYGRNKVKEIIFNLITI